MSYLVYLAGSAFMFMLVVALGLAVSRTRTRTSDRLGGPLYRADDGGDRAAEVYRAVVGSPVTWSAVFLAMVVVAVASVIFYFSDSAVDIGVGVTIVAALFGAGLLGYVLYGTYRLARSRGHSNALSITETLITLGLVGIVGVVVHLTVVT